ncbi:hypothetical protein TRICI_001611 [Trichomonascus ciferrii]|uniref:Arrestin-like N-terminal domain-containing protein n=1 Tax=Trichomonascus ciferrii TaxID=44093 RepID=A0A642V8Z0_9ASCO|nr:hypothetical protein TRICI_001611 [Trichomonascus ciferrii]
MLDKDVTVRAITVKIEGSCKSIVNTRMLTDFAPELRDTRGDHKETHEVLYQTQKVFPPRNIEQSSQSKVFTLPAGEHNYEFSFVIPLYSECASRGSGGWGPLAVTHKQTKLPPSFQAVDDMACVEYFLKVTVDRASSFRINQRAWKPVFFRPIDDTPTNPRPGLVNKGYYSRIPIALEPENDKEKKKGFRSILPRSVKTGEPSRAYLECRTPAGAILVPSERLPFQIFLHFTTPSRFNQLTVEEFTVSLFELTQLRADHKTQNFSFETKLTNSKKLNTPLTITMASASPSGSEDMLQFEVGNELLKFIRIPGHIPPTFDSCNIKRSYAIKISLGVRSSDLFSLTNVSVRFDITINSGFTLPSFEPPPPFEEELPAYEK